MPTVVQIVTAETDVVTYTLSSDAVVAVERSARIAADAVLQAAIDSIASGSIPDGDKGSITVASSGTVWTINAGAVTNAMLAGSIAQSKVTSLTSDLAAKAVLSGGNTFSGAQVMSHTSGPVLNVSRSDTATTSMSVVAQLTAVTSNDMGDGFGPLLVFRVTDTGVTNELIGSVGFVRSGGDTTGDFVVRPQVAGVPTELFRFKADGTAVVNSFTFAVTGNASVSGTNTGDQTSVSGNAGTATALQTARNINGVAFDGTANITVTAAAGTLTGTTLASNVVSSSLTGVGTVTTGTWNGTTIAVANGGTGATDAATARTNLGLGNVDNTSNATERAATATLTNKRITPRIGTTTSSATPSINTDTVDQYNITALAAAITSMTTNLSGTPTDGQKLLIRIKDNGFARSITWGASFQSIAATLPTTTTANKLTYVGLVYNSAASKWDCLATGTEA